MACFYVCGCTLFSTLLLLKFGLTMTKELTKIMTYSFFYKSRVLLLTSFWFWQLVLLRRITQNAWALNAVSATAIHKITACLRSQALRYGFISFPRTCAGGAMCPGVRRSGFGLAQRIKPRYKLSNTTGAAANEHFACVRRNRLKCFQNRRFPSGVRNLTRSEYTWQPDIKALQRHSDSRQCTACWRARGPQSETIN